jgi:hypothetical protein
MRKRMEKALNGKPSWLIATFTLKEQKQYQQHGRPKKQAREQLFPCPDTEFACLGQASPIFSTHHRRWHLSATRGVGYLEKN